MLDEMFDPAVPSETAPEPENACGCITPAPGVAAPAGESERPGAVRPDSTQTAAEAEEAASLPDIEASRRALKIVLSLRPAAGSEEPGYHVLLAVGAEGCDPLFRTVEVAGLAAALSQVPALVADAEARWRTQPRYPAAARREAKAAVPRSRPGRAERPAPPAAATDQDGAAEPGTAAGVPPARPAPAPKPAPADQLSLFG